VTRRPLRGFRRSAVWLRHDGAVAVGAKSSGNGPEQAFFSKLDTDGDGKISKTEFESAANGRVDSSVADSVFDKIDGDSDGSVSQGELAKADTAAATIMFTVVAAVVVVVTMPMP